jgi:hypothetical protein
VLLYFFNPILTSLRSIQQPSTLDKVGQELGVPRGAKTKGKTKGATLHLNS